MTWSPWQWTLICGRGYWVRRNYETGRLEWATSEGFRDRHTKQ